MATDGEGRVLLVRQRGGPFAGAWLLPGGALEPGESYLEAVIRETREETGLTLSDAREICRYDVVGLGPAKFHFRVAMFRGRVQQGAAEATAELPVAWERVDPATAHPMLVRQLADGGVIRGDRVTIESRCRELGLEVTGATTPRSPGAAAR